VQAVDRGQGVAYVSLPYWEVDEFIELSLRSLPNEIADALTDGLRLTAKANVGTTDPNQLFIEDWQLV
jgi:hypothetical protein